MTGEMKMSEEKLGKDFPTIWVEQITDPSNEGSYRRGYHQAVAAVVQAMRRNPSLTAGYLDKWVQGAGMNWRRKQPLERMIQPPPLLQVPAEGPDWESVSADGTLRRIPCPGGWLYQAAPGVPVTFVPWPPAAG